MIAGFENITEGEIKVETRPVMAQGLTEASYSRIMVFSLANSRGEYRLWPQRGGISTP